MFSKKCNQLNSNDKENKSDKTVNTLKRIIEKSNYTLNVVDAKPFIPDIMRFKHLNYNEQ